MSHILVRVISVLALVCVSSAIGVRSGSAAAQPSKQVEITDFDFTDGGHGWVLATVAPCSTVCPDLVLGRYDRGHWTVRALPQDMDWYSMELGSRVGRVLFVNHNDGWLYGIYLYSTHDGGENWNRVGLPLTVPSWTNFGPIVVRGGRVRAFVTACSGGLANPRCSLYRIGTSPVSHDAWDWKPRSAVDIGSLIRNLAITDGRHPWRESASLTGESVTPPCSAGISSVYFDGTGRANLWVLCGTSPGRDLAQRKAVYRSADGGKRWHKVWDTHGRGGASRFARGEANGLAVTSGSTAWMAVWNGPLMVTHGGGLSWQAALSSPKYTKLGPVQFTDVRQGWVESYPGTLLHTTDGGRTWHAVILSPPAS